MSERELLSAVRLLLSPGYVEARTGSEHMPFVSELAQLAKAELRFCIGALSSVQLAASLNKGADVVALVQEMRDALERGGTLIQPKEGRGGRSAAP